MDLANEDQVRALIQWVKDTEGVPTATECQKLVDELLSKGRREVRHRVELLDIARQRAHGPKVAKAHELARAKLDSQLRFGDSES